MEINKKLIKYIIFFTIPIGLIIFLLVYLKLNDPDFYIEDLTQKMQVELINSGAWNESCPAQLNRLKIVNVKYRVDKDTVNKNGQLILFDAIAPQALDLFKKLFKKNIFIEKIEHPSKYKTHKESMVDNNSLGFICDKNDLKNDLLNRYGVSLDINPLYNPSLTFFSQEGKNEGYIAVPSKSLNFVNRSLHNSMMNEKIVNFFSDFGFSEWGGERIRNPNYQYFSVNETITKLLFEMKPDDAKKFFEILVKNKKLMNRFDKDEFLFEIKFLYEKNSKMFLKAFKSNVGKLNKLNDSEFFDLLRKNMINK